MDVIICGGGDIGSSAAQVLAAAGDAVTIIESDDDCAEALGEHLDVALVNGSASSAEILRRAGVADAHAVIATTAVDEVNLVHFSCCPWAGRCFETHRADIPAARCDHLPVT